MKAIMCSVLFDLFISFFLLRFIQLFICFGIWPGLVVSGSLYIVL